MVEPQLAPVPLIWNCSLPLLSMFMLVRTRMGNRLPAGVSLRTTSVGWATLTIQALDGAILQYCVGGDRRAGHEASDPREVGGRQVGPAQSGIGQRGTAEYGRARVRARSASRYTRRPRSGWHWLGWHWSAWRHKRWRVDQIGVGQFRAGERRGREGSPAQVLPDEVPSSQIHVVKQDALQVLGLIAGGAVELRGRERCYWSFAPATVAPVKSAPVSVA